MSRTRFTVRWLCSACSLLTRAYKFRSLLLVLSLSLLLSVFLDSKCVRGRSPQHMRRCAALPNAERSRGGLVKHQQKQACGNSTSSRASDVGLETLNSTAIIIIIITITIAVTKEPRNPFKLKENTVRKNSNLPKANREKQTLRKGLQRWCLLSNVIPMCVAFENKHTYTYTRLSRLSWRRLYWDAAFLYGSAQNTATVPKTSPTPTPLRRGKLVADLAAW